MNGYENIKTVDELIEYYSTDINDSLEVTSTIHAICNMLSPVLLNVLKNENNKPSKHDLQIISVANKFLIPYNFNTNIHQILEIYKNRKELQ